MEATINVSGCTGNQAKQEIDLFTIGRNYGANKQITDNNYNKNMAVKCDNGVFVGVDVTGTAAWKGIPFAKAPIGERRFKA
ncbi:MAG: carboxylesterase family protein, partial [Bacteroidales bacterium]|nr:carboxylesterase family protein [Bacteroidales bacterium]